MSWRVIAERSAADPYRSRSLWSYVAAFVLVFGLAAYLNAGLDATLAATLGDVVGLFVPIVALVVGYQAVVGGRQNGGLRVLLSYPHTRREIVVGTAVGRALVMAALVTIGFLAAALVSVVEAGVPEPGPLAVAWALTVLLAVSMTGLAVGISASVRTTNRAAVLAFGAFLLFAGIWGALPVLVQFVSARLGVQPPSREAFAVYNHLNPVEALRTAWAVLVSGGAAPGAFYATAWFGAVVLVAWLCLPLAVGAIRFERSDL